MEDEGAVLLDGKALGNLRVVDLKQELEKRGLSKSGSKKDLVKRLKQQLELEKLCGERKSTGECDLKLELDADTEKNEFVQQYLAQQQKIFAEQKEVKRLIELGEVQKSGDERGSDSAKAEDASDTQDTSDDESQPAVFEKAQAISSIQESEDKIVDVDSSKMNEDLKQKQIKKKDTDCEKIPSPSKRENEEQNTDGEKVTALSESSKAKAIIEEPKIEVKETKKEDSSCQVKSVENVDCKIKDEENIKAKSEPDCKVDEDDTEPNYKNETKSSIQSPDNLEKEPQTIVSNVLDSSDVQPESKHEDKMGKESISESTSVHISEAVETEPRKQILNPSDSSNEPVSKNQNVSEQPRGEEIPSIPPSFPSETDKSSEKSLDLVMEPVTEVSNVPYALSENKENVMKPVPKPVREENVSETKKASKKDSHAKGSDSESDVKSPESGKELSEPEEPKNLNGKSSCQKQGRRASQETDNQAKDKSKMSTDPAPDEVLESDSKSTGKSQIVTRKEKPKSRKYSDESEEGEMKSESASESGESSDSSGGRRGRKKSRKGKRKVRRSGSSDSSRSRSRDSSSAEKVVKIDKGKSKSHDSSSKQLKSKPEASDSKQGHRNARKEKKRDSGSGSSNSSRSRSRGSSIEKVEKSGSEENSKVVASSISKSHEDANIQEKSKPGNSERKQSPTASKRKESRSESSNSSRSRSRDSSVEKAERMDTEENSKIDAESISESRDDTSEQEKSKPETSESKRGRRKEKRKISRSGSSESSRSGSRNSSVEKTEKEVTEENSKADADSISKKHAVVEKEKPKKEAPQKRLKLKRDNVTVSDLPHATKKDSCEDKSPIRKNDDAVVSETVDKSNTETTKPIEPKPAPVYVSTRKIRILGRKLSEKSEEEPKVKRGKWGSYSSSQKPSQAISISTDSIKNLFPDFKLLRNPDVINEAIEEMQVVSKEENPEHLVEKKDEGKYISQNTDLKDEQAPQQDEQIDDSEATNILFIQNLVRPFTLLQLKELLKETGNFIDEKFWIDKIKSKCFVTYSTVEEAIKTKTALNGTRWPSSNPKILCVEYSTEEVLELHQSGSEPPKALPPPPPPVEHPEPMEEHSMEDHRRKEREHQDRRRERSKPQPVREWDKNKLTQESPTRERVGRSVERSRSSDKKERKDSKRRPNEDTPAKLLDDLFQKTKSSPCIYWLPLTEEQVVEREEARRLRRLEREKRIQQREQEEAEHKAKAEQSRNRTREMERRRSSTRSRSPVSRRR